VPALFQLLGQDARLAIRLARRFPLFTCLVLLTIALGVGASTAIFSAVDAVMLRPLPFARGDRLVSLWATNPDKTVPRFGVSYPDFRDWKTRTRTFTDMSLYVGTNATLIASGEPENVADLMVTANFLHVLGVAPLVGRGFGPEDERGEASNSVLLSYGYWQRRFGGQRSVIGSTVTVAGRPRTIVGVLPPGAALLGPAFVGSPLDVMTVVEFSTYSNVERHAQHLFGAVARLKDGATLDQARADLLRTEVQVATENPEIAGWTASVFLLTDDLSLNTREPLLILLGASVLLLAIACINVANLLLVRGAARSREIAVRRALGASRGRLAVQFLVESVVLAVFGGAAAVGLAAIAIHGIRGMLPFGVIARSDDIGLSVPVLLFALGTSVLAAFAFGAWPAFRAGASPRLDEELRDRSQAATRSVGRRALVVAEFSLALVLLVCAGLVWQSVRRMLRVDPGFTTDHVVTASITLGNRYPDSTGVAFYRQLLTDLEGRRDVVAAGATDTPPVSGGGIFTSIRLIGQPPRPADQPLMSTIRSITPGYFAAMGMHLLAGTDLSWNEPTSSIVLSKSAATAFWPGQPVTDKQLGFNVQPKTFPIVGEVSDTRQASLATAPAPIVYVSMRRYARLFHTMTLVVRGRGTTASTVATIRGALRDIDPALPLYNVQTMQSIVDQSTAQPRLDITLLGMFALAALILAALGVYGVISYSVTQRRQEIGIRMALGARSSDIARMVLREGGLVGIIGVAVGLGVALVAARLIRSMLFGVTAADPATFGSVAAGLLLVALAASYLPARRAARVDPLAAIRAE